MNLKNRKCGRNLKQGVVLLAASLLAVHRMAGGPVIMGPPPVDTAPPAVQEDEVNNPMNVFVPSGVNNGGSSQPFQFGPVTLRPHVSYNFSYGSGIQSGINSPHDTIIQQLTPGMTVNLGRHWSVDYTPTLLFYSSKQFQNGVNHSASLTGSTGYEDWKFSLSQSFSSSDTPLTETAAQTSQQSYGTALGAGYIFNDKMSADLGLNQNLSFVTGFQNSYDWSTMDWLNYEFWPRFNAGIGAGAGYTKVKDNTGTGANNPDSINEQLQVRANWRTTDKISFQVSVGLEDQQFLAAGYSDSLNPVFSASVQYQPFKVTQISLTAGRTVSSSDYFVIAQSSENTTVSLNLNQRILVKYNLNLGLGYTKTDYTSTLLNIISTKRTDDTYSFSASFGRSFLKRGNWAVNYQYSDNQSSGAGFAYRSSQIGFQVGYSY